MVDGLFLRPLYFSSNNFTRAVEIEDADFTDSLWVAHFLGPEKQVKLHEYAFKIYSYNQIFVGGQILSGI